MKFICLIKFVPDVEDFKIDPVRHVLVRENINQILNPDDAAALAFALSVKRKHPETIIEVLTMGPLSVIGALEDLLRRHLDQATLLSDQGFAGSDTYATSMILASYLKNQSYDYLLSGTHSIDGDTSHVPSQLSELLSLPQMSNIIRIDESSLLSGKPVVDVDHESLLMSFQIDQPAILSLLKDSGYKLPYVAYDDLQLDVSSRIKVYNRQDLGLSSSEIGFEGSKTMVNQTFVKKWDEKQRQVVKNDDAGIETVYQYLKEQGFLK